MTAAPSPTTAVPPIGMLFDVDGPVASPVTRTVAIRSILEDIVALAGHGVPIAFITGRSDAFIAERLVAPLLDAGLADVLRDRPGIVTGVYEKGATWSAVTADGLGPVHVDESVAFAQPVIDAVRALVAADFADTMFFDETKRAMISVEQRTDVDTATYRAAQVRFDDLAFDLVAGHGLGIRHGERVAPDASGAVPFRVDPTIISTDVESVLLDKDRGAERALAALSEVTALPRVWRTIGDSRSDYKMADQLHATGYEVAHVDVRPADGLLEKPYRVIVEGDLVHDEAGAAFLDHWVRELGLR